MKEMHWDQQLEKTFGFNGSLGFITFVSDSILFHIKCIKMQKLKGSNPFK